MVRHHVCPTHRKIDLRGAGFVTVNGQGEITEERTAVARAIVSGSRRDDVRLGSARKLKPN